MPVLTDRFFLKIAVAWSPESPDAPPAETCIVSRPCRVFERFSTSTASHFAPEKSSPFGVCKRRPDPHSPLLKTSLTSFVPADSTRALCTGEKSFSERAGAIPAQAIRLDSKPAFISRHPSCAYCAYRSSYIFSATSRTARVSAG